MIAQPMSFRCKIRILKIDADPKVAGRSLLSFIIEESPKEAEGNSFFEKGKNAKGTSFDKLPALTGELIVFANVKFYGDPFHENFEVSDVVII